MTGGGQDPLTADEQNAVTLTQLCGDYPGLHICTDFHGHTRVWVARGGNGHPWLVLSSDLDRFRAALDGQP